MTEHCCEAMKNAVNQRYIYVDEYLDLTTQHMRGSVPVLSISKQKPKCWINFCPWCGQSLVNGSSGQPAPVAESTAAAIK